ncbi:hypothetical protein L2734_19855, partial [Parashewanella spongiae]
RHVYERVSYDTTASKQPALHGNDTSRQGVNHVQEGDCSYERGATFNSGNGVSLHSGRHVYDPVEHEARASKPALYDPDRQSEKLVQEGYYARPRDATSYSGNGTSSHEEGHIHDSAAHGTTV